MVTPSAYTKFNLSIVNVSDITLESLHRLMSELLTVGEFENYFSRMGIDFSHASSYEDFCNLPFNNALAELYEMISCDLRRWYWHDYDMVNVSRHFPDIIFILDGEREYDNSTWRTYFYNGKLQKCKCIEDNFDKSKLINFTF